jgi:hypothetical protein
MDVAFTLVALGGLYLISNNRKKEAFVNYGNNTYKNPNQTTDAYFKPPRREGGPDFTDMAGRTILEGDMVSTNMVPFFGTQKAIGPEIADLSEQTMDSYTGAGSLHMTKSEVAPLFKPEENVQWANGAPNETEFFRSRINPSERINNVLPFKQETVGPGLNKGYNTAGSGGFNSGMEARSLWLDKTVDELRVLTNPKESFELRDHQGPAQSNVKNLGIEGRFEKKLPDRYFVNSPDRYFTTTGIEQAGTLRSIQPDPTIHRATTSQPYVGAAGHGGVEAQPQHGMVKLDSRQQLAGPALAPAGGLPRAQTNDPKSYDQYANNRTINDPEPFGGARSLVNAITAPLADILRPSRKENTVGTKRIGNPGSTVPVPRAVDAAENLPPTMKETTLYNPYAMGQRPHLAAANGYAVANHTTSETNRAAQSVAYVGGASSLLPQMVSNEAERNAYVPNREAYDRPAAGNINVFSPTQQQPSSVHKPHPAYMPTPANSIPLPPTVNQVETRAAQSYVTLDRNNPNILDAFKQNPYTQSLQSVA